MKIALLLPYNHPAFDKKFIMGLLGVVSSFHAYNAQKGLKHELNIFVQNEGPIDFMRERLAEKAIESGYEYLFWMDCDMAFPANTLQRMIEHFESDETLEAVTGLYFWKQPPFMPHVYHELNKESGKFKVAATFPVNEPFTVEGAGYGCVMVKADVYKRIEQPWFEMKLDKNEITYGEDLFFFKKANPINMICDPVISCGHFSENMIDINSYLQYNGYNTDGKTISATDEQIKAASDEHLKRVGRLSRETPAQ